jgi:hypothetical protein
LEEAAEWQHASGEVYPYVAMQWLEGMSLYEWARRHNPTHAQVLGQLAQLARALAALQAQGCVHRDVKGDNILVRQSDGRAFLTDFGTGYYPGAATLTPPLWFPGTPAYRSPESWLFEFEFRGDSTARYRAGPAYDVHALGITLYRLLTGKYPELGQPRQDEAGTWRWVEVAPPAPHELNPRVEVRLSALCLRMLSVRPEARGTAEQLAEALEQLAQCLGSQSSQPLFAPQPPRAEGSAPAPRLTEATAQVPEASPGARGSARPASLRAPAQPWQRWTATTVAVLMLAGGTWWAAAGKSVEKRSSAPPEAGGASKEEDDDTAGLAEAASAVSAEAFPAPSTQEVLAEEPPPEPVPGQARPDANGRCPRKWQVALNGGCWKQLVLDREQCDALSGRLFKGTCYMPITASGRPPTSNPTHDP